MGKTDNDVEEEPDEDTAETSSEEPTPQEEHEEEKEEKKEDVEKLRKVIKVEDNSEKKEEPTPTIPDIPADGERENLEQKRAILQSIKDFDFQIKKNQEEITSLNNKLDSVSKDLDDLVSLYEIVSEQMNPFVGLSKVTKKRLDALENFTREIDLLKERTDELESFAERSGAKLNRIAEGEQHAKTIDTDSILEPEKSEGEIEAEQTSNEVNENAEISKLPKEEEKIETEDKNIENVPETDVTPETEVKIEALEKEIEIKPNEIEIQQEVVNDKIVVQDEGFDDLSDMDLDIIFEKAFGAITPQGKIDMVIDEFIESLKG